MHLSIYKLERGCFKTLACQINRSQAEMKAEVLSGLITIGSRGGRDCERLESPASFVIDTIIRF